MGFAVGTSTLPAVEYKRHFLVLNLYYRDKDGNINASELWLALRKLGYFGMSGASRADAPEERQAKFEEKGARKAQIGTCEQLIKTHGKNKTLQFDQFLRSEMCNADCQLNPMFVWLAA
jgi:hypothetical protein